MTRKMSAKGHEPYFPFRILYSNITEMSGRGVGMDIVKGAVESLGAL